MIKYFFLFVQISFLIVTGCENKRETREYYKSGKLKRVLTISDSNIRCLDYYENGKVESEGELLSDGHRVGPWIYYDEKGKQKAKGNYNDGLKEGVWNYNMHDSSYRINWDVYFNRPLKINVPNDWMLKENLTQSMPLAGFSDSSNWAANFNVVLLSKENKSLDSIIQESIKRANEKLGYSVVVLSTKAVEINALQGQEVRQRLVTEGKHLVVVQYFLEQPDTIFLLSFFVDENKFAAYDNLVKEIAYSFTPI